MSVPRSVPVTLLPKLSTMDSVGAGRSGLRVVMPMTEGRVGYVLIRITPSGSQKVHGLPTFSLSQTPEALSLSLSSRVRRKM
jgi:hypothetical protein